MTLNNDLLKVGFLKGINISLKFILSILTVRIFGIEGRGDYFKIIQLTGIVSFLLGFSVHDFFIYGRNRKENKEILELALAISFGMVLISSLLARTFDLVNLQYLGLFFAFWGEYFYFSYQKSLRKYNIISVYLLVKNAVYIGYLVWLNPSLNEAIFMYAMITGISYMIMYCIFNSIGRIRISIIYLRDFYFYARYIHINNVLNDVENKVDVLLILFLLNSEEIGIYSIVVVLVQSVNNLVNVVIQAVSPTYNVISKDERRLYWNILMYISGFSFLFWMLFGQCVLSRFYYIEYSYVEFILITLALAMVPEVLSKFLVLKFKYSNLEKSLLLKFSTVSVLSNVCLNLILTPIYGLYGVAFASLFSYALRFILIFRCLSEYGYTTEYRLMSLKNMYASLTK